MYPVDLLSLEDRDLTCASVKYLSSLETRAACKWFQSLPNSKVAITEHNIEQLQLFGDDQPDCTLLALHLPKEPKQVVALYLHEKWWHVDDVLRTSSKSRNGLEMVQSTVERVLVLVLSQLVDRPLGEAVLFSHHPRTESCKLLWTHGEAVGFYSFKHKGSLCENGIGRCYELPVLDTIFVRNRCRRRGFGLLMLEDFYNMFPTEEVLGVSAPLSAGMVAATSSTTSEQTVKNERDGIFKEICNPSLGETSPNSGFSQTGSSVHTPPDPHCGPPMATAGSRNTKQALKCKARVSVDLDRKELEETNREIKRERRT